MSDYKIETKCIQSGYDSGEWGTQNPADLPEYDILMYNSSDQMGRLFDLEEVRIFLYQTYRTQPTMQSQQRSAIWRVEQPRC